AAIIARELGVPAIVGTGNGLDVIPDGAEVTVSCAEGDTGFIYEGLLPFERITADLGKMPPAPLKIMMNVANPERAFDFAMLPNAGVGLARLEMIIASHIGVHPKALLDYDAQDAETKRKIDERMAGYASPVDFYVDRLAEGIATITAAFAPEPVIVRLSDFKTNEYANLRGGTKYEANEENPMIGFRGASRYIEEPDVFQLEIEAIKLVRAEYNNLYVMVPFVRTPAELTRVKQILAEHGLQRGDDFKLWMMVEVPSNVLILDSFIEVGIDGISIGSNDLTQLVLGVDRDSEKLAHTFDERNEAVMLAIQHAVLTARRRGITVSICGQAPSVYPEVTEKLVEWGATSVSVSPDMINQTREIIANAEVKLGKAPKPD
ncbi:MAG: phosphoenolpyruvate synthase, partial [Dehalococcoidia bacterium]|nr:phosphoenolpyruvate synthase [Dehalococcoidia bacterium]